MKKTHRIISWMPGSSIVTVKDKCRLGGGTICNQGDITNLNLKTINEEIDTSEAGDVEGSVQTILDGKRNVGLIHVMPTDLLKFLGRNGINIIPVSKIDGSDQLYILYNNNGKQNALKLREVMNAHGGYVSDKSPEEAKEIGKLLEYSDKTINEYIKRKYGITSKLPVNKAQQASVNETMTGGEYTMYHGSNHIIEKFTDEYVGQETAKDQEGPGIYFTSLKENAESYGKYTYKVILRPKKLINSANKKVVSVKNIAGLIKMSPNWKEDAQNWDENINKGLATAIKDIIDYAENEKDLYQQIWIDFFRYNPIEFVRGMVKLGFDGQFIDRNEGVYHIIMYNPNAIEIIESNIDSNID